MYEKTLYNDDCILDTEKNTVIFNVFKKYKSYLEWVDLNPEKEKELINKKQNSLKFNQGFPIEDGNSKKYFDRDGKLYCEEILSGNEITEKIHYNTETEMPSEIFYFNGDEKKNIKYDYFGNILEKEFLKNNIIIEKITYFLKSNTIKKQIVFSEKNYEVKEYYTNGNLRSIGEKNIDFKPIGIWKFYHHNGNIESIHEFKYGKLVNNSTLFFEDGAHNTTINHETKN